MDKMRTPLFSIKKLKILPKKIRKKISKKFGNGQNAHPLIQHHKVDFLARPQDPPKNPKKLEKKLRKNSLSLWQMALYG